MAAINNKVKEHAFVRIGKDIKEGRIPRLVLLCGKEEYLISWYADMLINKYVSATSKPIDLNIFDGDNISVEAIKESLETVSLMSERKVVYLPDFKPAAGKGVRGFNETDLNELISYFSSIPEGSLLLITHPEKEDGARKPSKFKSAVEKNGAVYDFEPLSDGQLKNFIEKRFNASGKSFTPAVIRTIMSDSGYGNKSIEYDLYNLDNDIKKIIAYSGDNDSITIDDVKSVLTFNPENNVFLMLDAIGRNRKDEAFVMLHNLLQTDMHAFALIKMIVNQLEMILSVKEMRNEGASLPEMQKKLGIHQFRLKKAMAVTGLYSINDLRAMLKSSYEIDENIKTGLLESKLALEYFIACI